MLSGRRAFGGATVTDTLASVMRDSPPLDVLPTVTPPRVRLLIARCLERDQRRRLRDIGDARLELETLDSAAAAPASEQPTAPHSRIRGWRLLAAGLILVAATAAITSWIDRMTAREASAGAPVMRLTSDAGLTTDPALSPDGKLVCTRPSRWRREPRSVGATDRRRRAAAFDVRPQTSTNRRFAGRHPDCVSIRARRWRRMHHARAGGEARLIARRAASALSPDGSRIA